MPLDQLLQVCLGPLLLLVGDFGYRQSAHERPEVDVRLRLEVLQRLLGGHGRLKGHHEPVEALVVERLVRGVVLAGGREPHPLGCDGDVHG